MRDIPIAELDTALETDLLKQVLTDMGIPFRIELNIGNMLGIYFGAGSAAFQGHARVWAMEEDEAAVLAALAEVRQAEFIEDVEEYLPKGRMWRIKNS